ncbi:Olfactory receptor 4C11, partial [Camelus dromedarius]
NVMNHHLRYTENRNNVTEFVLLGLTQNPKMQTIVFVVFLVIYIVSMVGNVLTMVTISASPLLESPMYFFLAHLSFIDACYSCINTPKLIIDSLHEKKTSPFNECMMQIFGEHLFAGIDVILLTVMAYDRYVAICKPLHYTAIMNWRLSPRLIVDALSAKKIISYSECMTQVFALHFFGCMEVFVLILMAVDRYVAICKPLRYPTIMSRQVCIILITLAWIGSFMHSMAQIIPALRLPFCGPNLIDRYCCDLQPLLKLACMDTYAINLLWVTNSGAICSSGFVILMTSYILILHSLQNHSAEARKKALSTCTSHVIVVVLTFGPCVFIYTRPPTTFPMDKMVAVFYTIGTPFLNPIIYTLRNAEVKNAMRKLWHVKITSENKR